MKLLLLLLLLLLAGCAPMTEQERLDREFKRQQIHEDWSLCRLVYDNSDAIWISRWHQTRAHERNAIVPRVWDMEDDLTLNNCHSILRAMTVYIHD